VADWASRNEAGAKFATAGEPHTGMISRLVQKRALKLAHLGEGKRCFEKLRAFSLNGHLFH
jgi:hypothetical protein